MNKIIFLSFCGIFSILGIVLVAVAFSTDYWLEYTVNEDSLKTDTERKAYNNTYKFQNPKLYHNRNRGLFRTCYDKSENWYDKITRNKIDDRCFAEEGYEIGDYKILNRSWKKKMDNNYTIRTHLMRAWFILIAIGLLTSLVSAIVGAMACYQSLSILVKVTALITLIASILVAGGIACFHGVLIMEREKITEQSTSTDEPEYFEAQLKRENTKFVHLYRILEVNFHYSYFIGWIGCGFLFLSAILYLICGFAMDPPKEKKPKPIKNQRHTRQRKPRQQKRRGKRDDEFAIANDRYHQKPSGYDNPDYGAQEWDVGNGYGDYGYNAYNRY